MKRHSAIPIERWSEVQRRLDTIARDQHCRILFAVESGSRLGLSLARQRL